MKKAQHRALPAQLLESIRQRALDLAADCEALAAELAAAQLTEAEALIVRKLDERRCYGRTTNRKHGYRCLRPQEPSSAPFCAKHAGSPVTWPGAPPEVALEFVRRAMGSPAPSPKMPHELESPPAELVAALDEPEPLGPRCPDCDHPEMHDPGGCPYPSDAFEDQPCDCGAPGFEPKTTRNDPEPPEDGPGEPPVEPSASKPSFLGQENIRDQENAPESTILAEEQAPPEPVIHNPPKGGFSTWLAKKREAEADFEGCSTCGDSGVLKERLGRALTSRPCPTCNPLAEEAEAAARLAERSTHPKQRGRPGAWKAPEVKCAGKTAGGTPCFRHPRRGFRFCAVHQQDEPKPAPPLEEEEETEETAYIAPTGPRSRPGPSLEELAAIEEVAEEEPLPEDGEEEEGEEEGDEPDEPSPAAPEEDDEPSLDEVFAEEERPRRPKRVVADKPSRQNQGKKRPAAFSTRAMSKREQAEYEAIKKSGRPLIPEGSHGEQFQEKRVKVAVKKDEVKW